LKCKKINIQFLYRDDFVFAQHVGCRKTNVGMQKETAKNVLTLFDYLGYEKILHYIIEVFRSATHVFKLIPIKFEIPVLFL